MSDPKSRSEQGEREQITVGESDLLLRTVAIQVHLESLLN